MIEASKIIIFLGGFLLGFFITKLYNFLTPKQKQKIKQTFDNFGEKK